MKHIPPQHEQASFHCPYCGVFSRQFWAFRVFYPTPGGYQVGVDWLSISRCDHCEQLAIWKHGNLICPDFGTAPPPNPDMPPPVIELYKEAALIASKSPRGAAALLRLAVQVLCKELGEPGENINADIASLVKKGLAPLVQKSLDAMRVIGNNAVHPGQVDADDPAVVSSLFGLLNLIVESMITHPKHVESVYNSIPQTSRIAIDKRDGRTSST